MTFSTRTKDLFPEEPEEQAQQNTDKNGGGDRKINTEAVPVNDKIPRQAAQRQLGEPRPEQAGSNEQDTRDDEDSGHFLSSPDLLTMDLDHAHNVSFNPICRLSWLMQSYFLIPAGALADRFATATAICRKAPDG